MEDIRIKVAAANSSRLAKGHAQGKTVANWDLQVFEGAGALCSTGDDMMLFLKAQKGSINSELWPHMQKTQQPLFDIDQGLSRQTDKIGMVWLYVKDESVLKQYTGTYQLTPNFSIRATL